MKAETAVRDEVASRRIAGRLLESILGGELPPGTRILQEELAEQFGASRIPVREAIRMLQADGLVTLVANSGAWVSALSLEECSEAYMIRERLEPLLLRTSMASLDDTVVDELERLALEMEISADVDFFIRTDRAFHFATYRGAPASMTREIIEKLWNRTQYYRRLFATMAGVTGIAVTHMEHHLLVDCIRRRDFDDAERLLVTHIRRTRLELEGHPELFVRERRSRR